MGRFKGKNALLTGAAGGIGAHIARTLAAEGINLVISGRRRDALDGLARSLSAYPVKVTCLVTDLSDPAQVKRLPGQASGLLGPIDILVNNAGIDEIIAYEEQSEATIEATIMTNLMAPLLLTRALLPQMLARSKGWIINMSSLSGRLGMPFGASYAASKAALSEWSLSLHAELLGRGVSVSALCPGFVINEGLFARKGYQPPGLLGNCTPEQAAGAVLRALATGKPEIIINNRPIRPMMVLKSISPGFTLWLSQRLGLIGFLKTIAADTRAQK